MNQPTSTQPDHITNPRTYDHIDYDAPYNWRDDAACRRPDGTIDFALWFGPHVCSLACEGDSGCLASRDEPVRQRVARVNRAKAICAGCPVREECLDWALSMPEQVGIAGAKTERERSRIRAGRG